MYLYVLLLNPRPEWLALPREERAAYFSRVNPPVEKLIKQNGLELLGYGLNEEETPHRADYRYFIVWRLPSQELVPLLEQTIQASGWYDYFDQINARSEVLTAKDALDDMAALS